MNQKEIVKDMTTLDRLTELENIARTLEPDAGQRKAITDQAAGYVDQFINTLPSMPGYVKSDCEALRALKVSDKGKPFGELLGILRDEVDRAGINSASGAHLGYIPGGGAWASSIADMLAAATNRFVGIFYSSPGAVLIENQMIRWLCSLVGYPSTAFGNLTSGGSMANLVAIKAARDAFQISSKNVTQSVIYFTGHVHHCVHKALHMTGLHEAVLRTIPMNDHFQMDTEALQQVMEKDKEDGLRPFLVIASAGTTDTGAVDPFEVIAGLCTKHNAWFHVDAAYGGFFLLVDEIRKKFKGIEKADSLVLDPHKSMFLPYGIGVALVKNAATLIESNAHKASYMQDAYGFDEISPSDCGPELSKHFRGLRMWLPLHLHGVDVFRANLEEKLLLCRYFHEEIGSMGFETGPDPQLSVALFRLSGTNSNELNQKLVQALHADGRCFFSSTVINGTVWIRCAVLSFRTHLVEIKLALKMIQETLELIHR